jgi:hypothetical protein
LVVREAAKICPNEVFPGEKLLWDGRFEVRLGKARRRPHRPMILAALGHDGGRHLGTLGQVLEKSRIPAAARVSLPTLWVAGEPLCVPHLGVAGPAKDDARLENCTFSPKNGLIGTWFTVA